MRDATFLRLISEVEALLLQLGAADVAQAQRVAELVARLRDADQRAHRRLRDRFDALLEVRAGDAQQHAALAERLERMEAALHGQAHKNQSIVERLDAALNAQIDEGQELSAVAERLGRIEAALQAQAAVADRLERIEVALQTQASAADRMASMEEALQAQNGTAERLERIEGAMKAQASLTERIEMTLNVLEKGQEGLHRDNAEKLERDVALATSWKDANAHLAELERGIGDLSANPQNFAALRRTIQDRAISAFGESPGGGSVFRAR